jgi:hypothetical protein
MPIRTPRRMSAREIRIILRMLGEESWSDDGFPIRSGMTGVVVDDS